ncbi:MAG: O-acetyl-ADP-ribose deacetylase [Melioribacter sp.]|nr:O-acetyl-ADP-ribose deacetylase [Melioribacter sp.]
MDPRIEIVKGDITKLQVDAIVNAANSTLLGGGGVDGAIHRAAGPQLLEECKKLGGCPTGEAKITKGYNLPAKYVIHTVGPVWNGGNNNEDELLSNCYKNSLKLAIENKIKTIAFPSISTGAYRFPVERASRIAFKTVTEFLSNHSEIEKVIFCCFDEKTFEIYKQLSYLE